MQIGIDAIAIALPRRFVAMEDLAAARGIDPAKYTLGLGAREMAVAEPGEDTVALAANAAERVLAGRERRDLGMLVVGTETGVDHSKPVASFVHGLLELPRTMRVFDAQHACYGGTAGVMAACEWIASGAGRGRSALVVCSDIARYGVGTAGEPTQGAGAVAMVIKEDPAIAAIDIGGSGSASVHVHDFWRPLGQREAEVDGHYSVQCYLDALTLAYAGWREKTGGAAELARVCYHVPFCKMAKKAHEHILAPATFETMVAPSLALCSRVGNIYTGSLYLGLAGLLDAQAAELSNQRIGLFSYGSGCTSEFFSALVSPRAHEAIARARISEMLAARTRISVTEYERIMALREPLGTAAGLAYTGTEAKQRRYARLA
ncbi:MAG TPA: hydroxymethylglutaryl-CoA synthase family protein [Kofleriaceae bacterium]|nr:hydroxymethylglutaryl-CoA synthase family protein [Kofleriaceae bacterium]